jgi:DNA primase
MAKISPVSIKYTIHAKFFAQGSVEKPDVIGALFGQTEGLLGNELEMRELQKEGKIGRIEVNLRNEDGKTVGDIQVPSALDKAETALIGAAIETIDKIGPTEAKIEVERIEDVRGEKRSFIVDRAKKLLEGLQGGSETREMADDLKTQSRLAKLSEYGDEKLPAGDVSGHEIIVVEGRADVVNLLKNNVANVIGMNGTKLPEAIKQISYDKEVTLFVDGDRGGLLIAKNVCDNARVDFIAVAPDGKEVEELTGKEILTALRRKVPSGEFFRSSQQRGDFRRYNNYDNRRDDRRDFRDNWRRNDYRDSRDNRDFQREEPQAQVQQTTQPAQPAKEMTDIDRDKLKSLMKDIDGTKSAHLLNSELDSMKKVSSRSIGNSLMRQHGVLGIITDALVTSNIVHAAEKSGVKFIAAKNFAFTETQIKLISL